MRRKKEASDPIKIFRRERCMNPWNGECNSEDIALYIFYRDEKLPICRDCWKAIASGDFEW